MKRLGNFWKKGIWSLAFMGVLAIIAGGVAGIRPFIVMSGSMEPAIPTGAVCFVNVKTEYDEIKVGDIIAYKRAGTIPVTHRVTKIVSEGMITKGDANDVEDAGVVTKQQLLGKTVFSIPKMGYFLEFMRHPAVWIPAIVLVGGLKFLLRHIIF